jgi:ribonucleoside-diphosphate reductase alpha chain
MKVLKRNGKLENLNDKKIHKCVERACKGLKNVDPLTVVFNATLKLYDGVLTAEIDKSLIKSARALIEQQPEYSQVAARLLLNTLNKEVFKEGVDSDAFELQYKKSFITNLKALVKNGTLQKELLKSFDLKKISDAIDIKRDHYLEYLGLQTIVDRYLCRINDKIVESPQGFFMRVAMGIALAEKPEDRTDWAIKFYDKISSLEYVPSTPTLFYSGNVRNQLSSCFLNTYEDSVFGIFDGLHQEAQKSKFAGGLGMDFTPFRAGGAQISTTGGLTTGAVYTWKLFNDMLIAINQGGKRKGAGCGYLETWHYDIEDFLELRKNVGEERRRTHDMNTANWIPDLFMKQVKSEGKWYLFSPEEVPELHELWGDAFEARYWECVEKGKKGEYRLFREIEAKDLWKKMLKMIFETGHPWITFKDPCNIRYTNQHCGTVHSSNLCTEITLHTKATSFEPNNDRKIKEYGETAVCNLGSPNLARHLILRDDGKYEIDYLKLGETVAIGCRMLDNVIDINFYPTQEAKLSNMRHRPVGLGSMGWHDMYHALDVVYDSDEATKLSSEVYEFISWHAINQSAELAKERGKYSTYDGSLWSQDILPVDSYIDLMMRRDEKFNKTRADFEKMDWSIVREKVKEYGMRNSNVMAIAPTATISSIAGCSSTTEPLFSNIFAYSTLSGDFTMLNKWLINDLKAINLWNHNMVEQLKAADGDISKVSLPDDVREKFVNKYKTTFQIDQLKLLEQAAARGIWIDQAMSVNLFNDKTSLKYLNDIYEHAWNIGLKTTYYLRNRGASSVEKASVKSDQVLSSIGDDKLGKACLISDPTCQSCQ